MSILKQQQQQTNLQTKKKKDQTKSKRRQSPFPYSDLWNKETEISFFKYCLIRKRDLAAFLLLNKEI